MKISLDTILTDVHKKPIQEDDPDSGAVPAGKRSFTLRACIIQSLFNGPPAEKLGGPEKLENYRLALKIRDAGPTVDLSVPEASKILKRVDDAWSTLIVGQCHDLMEEKN